MKIGRNDKCHCKSGKKYKKCCIDLPTVSIKKLNKGMSRRYETEFALHSFSSNIAVCYSKDLNKLVAVEANYHIYMINKMPRLSFVEDSLQVYKSHFEISIKESGENEKVHVIELFFSEEIEINLRGTKYLSIKNNTGEIFNYGVLACYREHIKKDLQLEILYVGQSYGVDGNRNALNRLTNHSTFLKIYQDVFHEETGYEIVLTLWDFKPILLTSIDGGTPFTASNKENKEHREKVLSNVSLKLDNHIINITEAALINYFKPHYNQVYKENFPDIKHKGYKYYYDYDFNGVVVELDTSGASINIRTNSKSYDWRECIEFNLHSEENRKSIFSI